MCNLQDVSVILPKNIFLGKFYRDIDNNNINYEFIKNQLILILVKYYIDLLYYL